MNHYKPYTETGNTEFYTVIVICGIIAFVTVFILFGLEHPGINAPPVGIINTNATPQTEYKSSNEQLNRSLPF
jgi:hypothetical protein